ncbi:DNA polymerase III subunit beta [Streptomyces sp. NPDC088736]|uniref:DNA polymerase III subunit beta n=1 Tax=Streptomyces sp. NPDC088736 TaxID=3365881 RepID=UPI00380A3D9A
MKIRIDQKELADAAQRAYRRLPNNPLNPVLAGLLIEAPDGGPVTLSGFDLETATRATLDADVLAAGETVVPGRILADVAAALPTGPVDVAAEEHQVTVSTPGNDFRLPVLARSDYPALPVPPGTAGTVDGDLLAAKVGHAATAALGEKEAVGNMEGFGGVHVAAHGSQLVVSASDRYRIVRHTLPWTPDVDTAGELLMPAAGFSVTAKQMAGGPVHIAFPSANGTVAALANDRLAVTSRILAAAFPNIDGYFPKVDQAAGSAVFEAAELAAAVKRAALVGDDKSPIKVLIADGKTEVRGGTGDSSGRTEIEADTDLVEFGIAFNPGYLASLLAPIDGQVQMWFTTSAKPALIEPVDDATYRAVCMPVRLK